MLLLFVFNQSFVMLLFDVPLADTEPAVGPPTAITSGREGLAQRIAEADNSPSRSVRLRSPPYAFGPYLTHDGSTATGGTPCSTSL